MKITPKLYNEIYDFLWLRADIESCSAIKKHYYSKANKGRKLSRREVFNLINKLRGES